MRSILNSKLRKNNILGSRKGFLREGGDRFLKEFRRGENNPADGRSRTDTRLPSLDFESSASTNSTTSAGHMSPRRSGIEFDILALASGNNLADFILDFGPVFDYLLVLLYKPTA